MRLKSVKLSGFKSFVESTAIPISGNLIGIVGPNGCGKSNIIDAVRWVMGESSAKHLRGDSMADVIFNGSNTRKPVALASVELVFDNSDGRAGGQYASYAEISIRREAGRDGQSDYFLNKVKCRRKDITDLFLGTGLGPRAYSIIEQGMVTRIIEAKPEELRFFIEEAAGISRYKERRRETENRIKHTRENLTRVEDIRRELESQLAKLERQSKAAAKYKELKQDERRVKAQLLALRWRELDARLKAHDRELAAQQNALDERLAAQRAIEAEIEKIRAHQAEANDRHSAVQAEYYAVGGEVTRLEQSIEHARETREQQKREQEQVNRTWDESSTHLRADQQRLDELRRALERLAPGLAERTRARDETAHARAAAEEALAAWQAEWEAFNAEVAELTARREIQEARGQQLEGHVAQLQERRTRLEAEAADIDTGLRGAAAESLRREAGELDEACARREKELAAAEAQLREVRGQREALSRELDELRARLQAGEVRLASLHELQAEAEGHDDAELAAWLRERRLDKAPRLAGKVTVEGGWEKAVERVLGGDLAALCVAGIGRLAQEADKGPGPAPLTLIDLDVPAAGRESGRAPLLLDKLRTDVDLTPLLAGVYVAENLAEALERRGKLAAHESLVTREGHWAGRNWLSLAGGGGERGGMIARRREMETLETQCIDIRRQVDRHKARLDEAAAGLARLEQGRDELARRLNEAHHGRAEMREKLGHNEAQHTQLSSRRAQIERERAELDEQLARHRSEGEAAERRAREAQDAGQRLAVQRSELSRKREVLQAQRDEARAREAAARDAGHRLELEHQGIQTSIEATRGGIERLEDQLRSLSTRREELARLLADDHHPEEELRRRLDEFLRRRLEIEARLTQARQAVTGLDNRLREQEPARAQEEKRVQEIRERHETERVAREALLVRRDTLADQLREAGSRIEEVIRELPPEASEPAWAERLEQVAARIERLGPINLVAIEEFEESNTRKMYLDKQYEDLSQALATLEEAIRKMDRETRTRFKETFDRLNEGFQNFFPQLFGGGSAYLELTDNDLLETGVTVMARPPGKRNSTIHLLSGGEKALSAVALLFAIFELNPAPFCLLDEVDAPLDDANVLRYCETLKTLALRTQLVYVTHNKISMEMADVLIGVTMSEPGVSRLVAVDVDAALAMVAS
jgi:chromosome segregation protein